MLGFTLQGIEDLCRIGISIATARSGLPIGGIQFISDSMGQVTEQKKGHTNRVGHLLPYYLVAILNWCESDDDIALKSASKRGQSSSEDPLKSYIRTKLNKISEVFQTSKFIADSTPVKQPQPQGDEIAGMGVIVGETSGQIIASSASTANPAPQITLAGSLEEQMNNLRNHFRLLAGPLGPDEEEDISERIEGDSLTFLRNEINKKKDSGERDSELNINPEEYEKEFKMNFNITDDISKKEVGFDGKEIIKTIKRRSSRAIPHVKLSPMECTYILEDMRRVCGKSPAALLSVKAIEGIYSGPSSCSFDDDNVDDNDDNIVYQQTELTQRQQQEQQQQQQMDGTLNGRIDEAATHVTVSYDINGEDEKNYDRDNDSDSNNRSSSEVDQCQQLEIGVKWDIPQSDNADEILMKSDPESTPISTYSPFVKEFTSLSEALKAASSDIVEAAESVEKSFVKDDIIVLIPPHDSIEETSVISLESNSNTTMDSERSVPKTVTVDTSKAKPADDAAAAHRRKVKNILAMLSSQSDKSEDSEVGKPKQEKSEVKKKSSKSSLTEEQTDTLARLLEQRIHDRWSEAAKTQNTIPRPFR